MFGAIIILSSIVVLIYLENLLPFLALLICFCFSDHLSFIYSGLVLFSVLPDNPYSFSGLSGNCVFRDLFLCFLCLY